MVYVASPAMSREETEFFCWLGYRCAFLLSMTVFMFVTAGVSTNCFAQGEHIVVATLGGKEITQREVDESVATKIFPLHQQLYAVRKVALENLITTRLIENEAIRQKISVAEMRKSMMSGSVNITREQIESAYIQNAAFFAAMSPDEAKERLRLDLESQQRMKYYRASLDRLRKSAQLVVRLLPPPVTSDPKDRSIPTIGSSTAAVTIVEFSDFECPFCKTVQPTLKQVLKEFGENVKLEFRNLPLQGHKNAFAAALSAYCAGKQDRFWPYHDALFSSANITADSLRHLAIQLGLNLERFQTCVLSQESMDAISSDIELARRFQIESTPSFIINGQLVGGAISFEEFRRLMEKELRIQGFTKATSSN